MPERLNLTEIQQRFIGAENAMRQFCIVLKDEKFFFQPEGKWSPAQQVKHLIVSANATRPAFSLPKFMVRLYSGKPNRPSRTFDELVDRYNQKLKEGGKASKPFIPEEIDETYGKDRLLNEFKTSMNKLLAAIMDKWDDTNLDNYLAPHPLLGKITLRELCYFTIHHTWHHLESIQKMTVREERSGIPSMRWA